MESHTTWKGGTQYEGTTESGHSLLFDTDASHTAGPSPMEAVLTALRACTSVDMVSILRKKRQPLGSLMVRAQAAQATEAPRVFTSIHVTYTVGSTEGEAPLDRHAVEAAVALSEQKYCSVSIMLGCSVKITTSIEYASLTVTNK
jgi:putative redox protein